LGDPYRPNGSGHLEREQTTNQQYRDVECKSDNANRLFQALQDSFTERIGFEANFSRGSIYGHADAADAL
jgi:hypothetical protein